MLLMVLHAEVLRPLVVGGADRAPHSATSTGVPWGQRAGAGHAAQARAKRLAAGALSRVPRDGKGTETAASGRRLVLAALDAGGDGVLEPFARAVPAAVEATVSAVPPVTVLASADRSRPMVSLTTWFRLEPCWRRPPGKCRRALVGDDGHRVDGGDRRSELVCDLRQDLDEHLGNGRFAVVLEGRSLLVHGLRLGGAYRQRRSTLCLALESDGLGQSSTLGALTLTGRGSRVCSLLRLDESASASAARLAFSPSPVRRERSASASAARISRRRAASASCSTV